MIQKDIERIYTSPELKKYIVKLIDATRNPSNYGLPFGKYLQYGASPRASIGLFIAACSNALVSGRKYITPHDVKEVANDVLRHRIMLNYDAQADGVKAEAIIGDILKTIQVP